MLAWCLAHAEHLAALTTVLGAVWAAARHIIKNIDKQLVAHFSNTFASKLDVKRMEKKLDLVAALVAGERRALKTWEKQENDRREHP
jgi:hypothetical protein